MLYPLPQILGRVRNFARNVHALRPMDQRRSDEGIAFQARNGVTGNASVVAKLVFAGVRIASGGAANFRHAVFARGIAGRAYAECNAESGEHELTHDAAPLPRRYRRCAFRIRAATRPSTTNRE